MVVLDGVPQVAPQEAAEAMQRGNAYLLDVREDHEWQQLHVPGARHIPMSRLQSEWETLPRDRPVLVLCAVGGRSQAVARFLAAQGYEASNIVHGIMGWQRAGLEVE
jgi:rhodanese-related sulfurtransferase